MHAHRFAVGSLLVVTGLVGAALGGAASASALAVAPSVHALGLHDTVPQDAAPTDPSPQSSVSADATSPDPALQGPASQEPVLTYALSPVPDIFVGQFAEVVATTNSGRKPLWLSSGPCTVRHISGTTDLVLVGTAAGHCFVAAVWPGGVDPHDRPERTVGFDVMKSQAKLRMVVPGPDSLQPGDELRIFLSAVGDHGDDPRPTGQVDVVVKGPDGTVVHSRPSYLDARGESLVEVPRQVTQSWPDGIYHAYATYLGDGAFHADVADPASLIVGPASSVLHGHGNVTMRVTPGDPVAGRPAKVTLTGFPDDAKAKVRFSVTNPRLSDRPVETNVAAIDGVAAVSFETGPDDQAGVVLVTAAYSFSKGDDDVSDVLRQEVVVHLRQQAPWMLYSRPEILGLEVVRRPIHVAYTGPDAATTKPAVLSFAIGTAGELRPQVTTETLPGWTCDVKIEGPGSNGTTNVEISSYKPCIVTIQTPETDYWQARSYTFTFFPSCDDRFCQSLVEEPPPVVALVDPAEPVVGRTVNAWDYPTLHRGDVISVAVGIDEPVQLRVPWRTPGDTVNVVAFSYGEWVKLATAVADPDGFISLPTLQAKKRGIHTLRFEGDVTAYLALDAEPR